MPIVWSIRNAIFSAILFLGLSGIAIAKTGLPQAIEVSNQDSLIFHGHELYVTHSDESKTRSTVHLSEDLHRAINTASTVLFPEHRSLNVAGKEYILIVVGHPSSSRPEGFCGAGEEDVLYVAEFDRGRLETKYTNLVRSCLKNIELESDGTESPIKSITWIDSPAGFRVAWLSDEQGAETIQTYWVEGSKFTAVGLEH